MDLVLNAVETGEHHRSKREIRIGHRVRETHFDTAALRIRFVWNANRSGAIARRVGKDGWRLESWHQPFVTVGSRIGKRIQCFCMLDNAADVVERQIGQAAVAIAAEQILAALEQGLVHMGAVTVVIDQRLRHESRRLPVAVCDVVHDIL